MPTGLIFDSALEKPKGSQCTCEEELFRALRSKGYEIQFRQECNRLHNGIQMYYNASLVNAY